MEMFETIIIFDATKETIAKAEIKKFRDIIQDWCKTKKVRVEDQGVKALAYRIQDIHSHGHYALFTYLAHPAHISELETELRKDDHVLKFLTVKNQELPELEDYVPDDGSDQSEQEKPDALDVLLGFANYK